MSITQEKLEGIEKVRAERLAYAGPDAAENQHRQGKLTARERIDRLFDPGTFKEIDFWADTYKYGEIIDSATIPGDGVIGGWGEISGRPVFAWAQDATLLQGTMTEIHIAKIVRTIEKATLERVPVIGIYDSEGLRLQNAIMGHNFTNYGTILKFQTIASGVIPQIGLVMGPCVEGLAFSVNLNDFVFMVKGKSYLHAVEPLEGHEREEFGGTKIHASKSGICAFLTKNDEECIDKCKDLLSYLPSNNLSSSPVRETKDAIYRTEEELLNVIPDNSKQGYDIRRIIKLVADDGQYLEVQADFAPNVTVGFAHFDGQAVGVIANNPRWLGGLENTQSSDKHSRFTRICDAFGLPIVYFADCPGFYPSIEEEHNGILRRGCMVIHSTAEATSPSICIVVRKIIGGAQLVMPSNICKTDRIWAWPTIERGTMGAEALVAVMFKGRIDRAETQEAKDKIRQDALPVMKKAIERAARVNNEEIIDPRQTRPLIIQALRALKHKKSEWPSRKHENINM